MYIKKSGWDFTKQLKWLDQYFIGHNGFIAGGFAKSIFQGLKIRDLDIFFYSVEDMVDAQNYYYSNEEYATYYENVNVVAFKNIITGVILELNRKIFGYPEDILNQFDFTISKFAYCKLEVTNNPGPDGTPWEDENGSITHIEYLAIYHENFFEHLSLKRLVVDYLVPYPASTFHRLFKYGKQGFFPCRGTKIIIMKSCRDLTDEQIESMQLYLTDGVD